MLMKSGKFNFCLVASRDGQKFINLPSVDYKTPNKRYLKTLYSAVSFGSESRTINNKKINFENLVNKKFIIKGAEVLRNNPLKIVNKIRNLVESVSPLGYSSINLDETTSKFVIAFGQYANHCSFTNVPNGMSLDIDELDIDKNKLALLSTSGILAIAINGCKGAIKHCERDNKKALIIGGGILGVMSFYYLKSLNYDVKISDPNKNALSNLLSLNLLNSSQKKYSIVIDASGSSTALLMYLDQINNYASICLLGESSIPECKSVLELKNSVLTFCNSFGSDRGVVDIEYDLYKIDGYPRYRSMQENIKDAYKLIINNKLERLNERINFINPTNNEFKFSRENINIIDWTCL